MLHRARSAIRKGGRVWNGARWLCAAASPKNSFGSSLPEVIEKEGWEGAWKAGLTPWDTKAPHAMIDHLLRSGTLPNGPVLVPGAGSGYDAFAFAKAGRRTTIVDISNTAIERCKMLIGEDPQLAQLKPPALDVRLADFFTMAEETPPFGVVWDYTFMAALPPSTRVDWARTMARLVAPDGCVQSCF